MIVSRRQSVPGLRPYYPNVALCAPSEDGLWMGVGRKGGCRSVGACGKFGLTYRAGED